MTTKKLLLHSWNFRKRLNQFLYFAGQIAGNHALSSIESYEK